MLAEIITIGDEILIGQIVDTNATHIAQELNKIGVQITQITSIQDSKDAIINSLTQANKRVDIVVMTGGLGPTKDDITKHTLCDFFDDTLVQNKDVLSNIHHLFEKHLNQTPNNLNILQSYVPSKATVLTNKLGTAPGMWLEKNNTVFISLPGVPYEMKGLLHSEVIPRLQQKFKRPTLVHKTLLTVGTGESVIANLIEDWENNLPNDIKLAYLPSLGQVRLRLSSKGTDENKLHAAIDAQVQSLKNHIGHLIVGVEGENSIEEVVAKLLKDHKKTLSIAESCTGGNISRQITKHPGASQYFRGSTVTYATDTKVSLLGVPESLITTHSVVSTPVAKAMAANVKKLYKTDYAIATTGNAGPNKGDADAKVGTVYIGIATPQKIYATEFHFGSERKKIIYETTQMAFQLLRKEILKNNS